MCQLIKIKPFLYCIIVRDISGDSSRQADNESDVDPCRGYLQQHKKVGYEHTK